MNYSLQQTLQLAERLKKITAENKIRHWKPIPKQIDFLNCIKKKKALVAGNRCGKTKTTLYELSLHLTGRYPSWWKGTRFSRPVKAWLVGMAFPSMKDTIQVDLLGEPGQEGTGFLPKDSIFKTDKKIGFPNAVESIQVRSDFGGLSTLKLWSSEQARSDFQAAEIDIALFDEEPRPEIHSEVVMRLATKMAKGEGLILYSFTPLAENSSVGDSLESDPDAQIFSISMDDVPWLDEKTINSMMHGLSDAEKNARRHGIRAVGGGRIYQFDESDYTCDSFEIPNYWPRIGGLDIGKNHPTGAVAVAWDRDTGCLYVYSEFKVKESSAIPVARELRHWGIQFATSHDAFNETFSRAECTADIFRDEGLRVFSAGRDVWMRIEKVRSLISDGKLFIFRDKCPELLNEIRKYHTKTTADGGLKIVKIEDDVVDALGHAIGFYEKAELKGSKGPQRPNFSIVQRIPVDPVYGI